jgi:hypothetical protein
MDDQSDASLTMTFDAVQHRCGTNAAYANGNLPLTVGMLVTDCGTTTDKKTSWRVAGAGEGGVI